MSDSWHGSNFVLLFQVAFFYISSVYYPSLLKKNLWMGSLILWLSVLKHYREGERNEITKFPQVVTGAGIILRRLRNKIVFIRNPRKMAFSSIDFWQTELHMLSFYDKSDTLFRLNCPNHGISDFVFLHFRSRDSYRLLYIDMQCFLFWKCLNIRELVIKLNRYRLMSQKQINIWGNLNMYQNWIKLNLKLFDTYIHSPCSGWVKWLLLSIYIYHTY